MDRTVNPGLANYMKAVDMAVLESCGVTYGDIYKDLHGDLSGMKESFSAGEPASVFVSKLIDDERLVLVTDPDLGASARVVNIRRASLVAFAAENTEWRMGGDRSVFLANEDGELFRMAPCLSRNGDAWGFAVDKVISGNPTVDASGLIVLDAGAEFERMGAGLDIEDAIIAFENRLNPPTVGMN